MYLHSLAQESSVLFQEVITENALPCILSANKIALSGNMLKLFAFHSLNFTGKKLHFLFRLYFPHYKPDAFG